jgi:hypothetical protein
VYFVRHQLELLGIIIRIHMRRPDKCKLNCELLQLWGTLKPEWTLEHKPYRNLR